MAGSPKVTRALGAVCAALLVGGPVAAWSVASSKPDDPGAVVRAAGSDSAGDWAGYPAIVAADDDGTTATTTPPPPTTTAPPATTTPRAPALPRATTPATAGSADSSCPGQAGSIDGNGLWVVNRDGSGLRRIPMSFATDVVDELGWSPDGRYLAFFRRSSYGEPLRVMVADTHAPDPNAPDAMRTLVADAHDRILGWDDRGRVLAAQRWKDPGDFPDLLAIDPATGESTVLYAAELPLNELVTSRDRRRIFLQASDSLVLLGSDGQARTLVEHIASTSYGPVVSADGDHVGYTVGHPGDQQADDAVVMTISTGEVRHVTKTHGAGMVLGLSPDGRYAGVAVIDSPEPGAPSREVVFDTATGAQHQLSEMIPFPTSWSDSGRHVVASVAHSAKSSHFDAAVANGDGSGLRKVITYTGPPLWVPGEDTLLWIASAGADRGAMCMGDAAGGNRHALLRATEGTGATFCTWTRDGRRLAFISHGAR